MKDIHRKIEESIKEKEMNKIVFVFMVGLFLLAGMSLQAQDALTLQQAIRMATHNQPLLREARDYVNVAAGQVKQSESTKLPQISAGLSYHFIGPVPTIALPFGPGGNFDLAPAHNYNGQVDVRYLIYDFHRRDELIKLLKSNRLLQEEKINLLKDRFAYLTVQAFYSVLFFEQSLKVKEEQMRDLQQHLATARKLVETGSAISLDTLTTRVRLTAIENQKIGIENLLEQNKIVLKSLLNLKKDTTLRLNGQFIQRVPVWSLDSLIQTAYAHREEIKLAQIGRQSAQIQKQMAKVSAAPTLSAIGSVGLKNGYPDALYRLRGNFVVGLAANFPIFEGHMKKAKIETADWGFQAVNEHLQALKKTVSREVQQAEANLVTSQKQLKMARAEIMSAEAAVQQARVQYKSGYATNLTLLDAETSLTRARLSYVAGLYKMTLSKYRLLETLGVRIW